MSGGGVVACGECGMPCGPAEYHPYAACLMFKGCHNSAIVRANLAPFDAAIARAEAAPVAVLLALAEQFDGMADAAYNDCEYDRRDVWRNAAQQARYRAKDASWQAAIAAQQAEGEA